MKKEPPSVFETILWALLAVFLVWFLTVGVHREEDDDDICDKIHKMNKDVQVLECEKLNFKEMT
jgi:hypothetical protein